MPPSFKAAVRANHPQGISFQLDLSLLVNLYELLDDSVVQSDPEHVDRAEVKRVGDWVAQYASATQLLGEQATLRYELEQSSALRLFPGEAINGLLRESANFLPGRAPIPGIEWTGVKLRKSPGIADMILTAYPNQLEPQLELQEILMMGAGSVALETEPTSMAALEYKRLKALPTAKMAHMVRAAGRSRRRRLGFQLFVEEGGKLRCDPPDAVTEDCLEICLQMYAELHSNRILYNLLFNSCDALIFKLDNDRADLIHLSALIPRDNARTEAGMNLAAAMAALALLPLRNGPWISYSLTRIANGEVAEQQQPNQSSDALHATSARRQPEDGRGGDGQVGNGSGSGGGGGSSGVVNSAENTSRAQYGARSLRPRGNDLEKQEYDSFEDKTSNVFPHDVDLRGGRLRMTYDNLLGLGAPSPKMPLSVSIPLSCDLHIGRPIGRGRLWDVYEGLLVPFRPSGRLPGVASTTTTLSISLDPGTWLVPTVGRSTTESVAALDAAALEASHPQRDVPPLKAITATPGDNLDRDWKADVDVSFSSEGSGSCSGSSRQSSGREARSGSCSSVHTQPTSATSSLASMTHLLPERVAIKIFDPKLHDGGLSEGEHEYECEERHRSARWETAIYTSDRLQALQDAVVPRCYAVLESPDNGARGMIMMIMEKVRPVFPRAAQRNDPLDSLCDQDRVKVARLVDRLHGFDWAHGDVELRHVVVASASDSESSVSPAPSTEDDWRLIDFDRAVEGHEAVQAERDCLVDRLGLCRWV